MPRFVVLEHDHPVLHWDLMLEHEGTLRTWRLLREPIGSEPIAAERLPNHRLAYLDYEGPVSGDRGHVTRWDSGTFETDNAVTFHLRGQRLAGRYEFVTEAGVLYFRIAAGPDA